jgi:hypothetical protein
MDCCVEYYSIGQQHYEGLCHAEKADFCRMFSHNEDILQVSNRHGDCKLREHIKLLFKLLTVSVIVQGFYYILYYSGQVVVFSNEYVEGFRTDGKPFLHFMLAVFQLILIYLIHIDIKKIPEISEVKEKWQFGTRVGSMHNISIRNSDSYYYMKLLLFEKGGWQGVNEYIGKGLGMSLLRIYVPRGPGRNHRKLEPPLDREAVDKAAKKIKRKYYRIGILMIIFPLLNLLINLIYIFEYSLPFEIPLPDAWVSNIQKFVWYLEKLWQYQWLAIIMCLIEIAIAATIYYRIFGIPLVN